MMLKDLQHIRYRRLLFSVNDYFLCPDIKPDADINYCIQCPENIGENLNEFYTLLIDLSLPLETIREGIYHRAVSEINSFLTNQTYEHQLIFDLSTRELKYFTDLFNAFANEKKIRKAEVYRLKAYNRHGILAVSYIKQAGQLLHVNFYRVTQQRAANLYSFPVKPSLDHTFNNTHLGRAHRSLHWLDILEFKRMGVNYYDFCGWYTGTEDQGLLNVNKFKEQFSKTKVKEYTGVIYKNKLLTLLMKFIR